MVSVDLGRRILVFSLVFATVRYIPQLQSMLYEVSAEMDIGWGGVGELCCDTHPSAG